MSKEKRLIILIIVYIISVLCIMLSQLFKGIFPIVLNIIIAIITVFAMIITKMEIDTNYKNYKQYIIGIDLCALLILLFGIIPLSCGTNFFIGSRQEFSLFAFIYYLFQNEVAFNSSSTKPLRSTKIYLKSSQTIRRSNSMISQRKSYTQRIPSEKIVAKDKPIYHPYQKSYSTTNLSNLKKNLGFSQTGDFFFSSKMDRFI